MAIRTSRAAASRLPVTLAELALPHDRVGAILRAALMMLAGVALLTLSAKVRVPFYPVPMTLQSLTVLLIGAAYGSRLGVATVLAYFTAGLFGMPVFTNTPPLLAGPAYFAGPTGGFLAGFLISAFVAGYAVERGLARRPVLLFSAMLAGQAAMFSLGFAWLAQFAMLANGSVGLGVEKAFTLAIQPFLIGDLVKTMLAAALAYSAYAVVQKR